MYKLNKIFGLISISLLIGCQDTELGKLLGKTQLESSKPKMINTTTPTNVPSSSSAPSINPSIVPATSNSTNIKNIEVLIPTNFLLNKEYILKAEVKFSDGTINSNDIIWSISDNILAKLEGNKLIPLKEGKIQITATYKNDQSKSLTVYAVISTSLTIPTPIPSLSSSYPTSSPTAQTQYGQTINTIFAQNGKISVDIYKDFKYVNQGWPFSLAVEETNTSDLVDTPYETLTKEPQYASAQVKYGYFTLGNGDDTKISFAIDKLDQTKAVVYVDKNNNEDLTDDAGPYINQGTEKLACTVSLDIDITLLSGEKIKQPYSLWFWLPEQQSDPKVYSRFYAVCHYAGKISINNTIYNVVAFEKSNHNGLFKESGLYIDLNNDNKITETTEYFKHGDTLQGNTIELNYP